MESGGILNLVIMIIPLIAGILVGKDASKRGMNAWGWGIGTFLLLIVFLPVYFFIKKPYLSDGGDTL